MAKKRYLLESALVFSLFAIFRILPLDVASGTGGWIGRTIGPRLAASRKALANLRHAFPDRDAAFYPRVLAGMWDNLGRIIAEYPHLETIARERTAIVNKDAIEALRDDGRPAVLFSGHLGNWETTGGSFLLQCGLPLHLLYRAPNNPVSARLLDRCRSLGGRIPTIPKSRAGSRRVIECLQGGGHLAILIDQKFNRGLAVPFLGRPALTSPSFVQLAQKFDCPLVPVRLERTQGAHFRITLLPPLAIHSGPGALRPVAEVIGDAHALLEQWIEDKPEQWLWLHRRWPAAPPGDAGGF